MGTTIDLLDHLPAVAKRVATIIVYGNAIDTDLEPRTFLVDAGTGETEGREVAVENRRQAYVDKVLGQESATPQPAAINSDYVAIANVVLTPAGVESVTQLTANQLGSIRRNAERIAEHDARFAAVGPQIDTLKTEWDPNAYADTYREELLRILSEKSPTAAPQPIVPAGTGPSAVEELMSALRESVEAAKARAEKKGSRSKRAG